MATQPPQADITRQLHDFERNLKNHVTEEIGNAFVHVNDATTNALLQAINDLKAEVAQTAVAMEARHHEEISKLTEEVKALRELQHYWLQTGHYFSMVPQSPFIQRLFHEHAYEKKLLADFVAKHYFADLKWGSHCFVQSSTIAHYLMKSVDANPDIDGSCLIYTNSAVAPIPMLFGQTISRHSIWPFRGHLFDNACGGWLLPTNDDPAFNAIRDLFRRQNDPLTTAFITPRYLVPNDAVYFEREEAAFLANVLATEAKHVVLLALGDRVKASRNELPDGVGVFPALRQVMATTRNKITVIVAWPKHQLQPIAHQLKASVGTLHWGSSNGWQLI